MALRRSLLSTTLLATIAVTGLPCLFAAHAQAEPTPQQAIDRDRLMDLARQFVDRVGGGMERAEAEWQGRITLTAADNTLDINQIPDGEILILQIRADRMRFPLDIMAIKDGGLLKISFADFIGAFNFPITFNAVDGIARGWFIREHLEFDMDIERGTIIAAGEVFPVPVDTIYEDNDYFFPSEALGSWFGITLEPDLNHLVVNIESERRLPILERMARRDPGRLERYESTPPVLPRYDVPQQIVSIPNVDVSLRSAYRRPPAESDRPTTQTNSASIIARGDIGRGTGSGFANINDSDGLQSLRLTYTEISEDGDLLGPLRARVMELGDVTGVGGSGAGGSASGLGARVSNIDPLSETRLTSRDFAGDAQPGWDVELYRNNQLVGFQTVGDDGRYRFNDIELFLGDNEFRIVQYGLQGEVREETIQVPVTLAQMADTPFLYDMSLTMQDRNLVETRQQDVQSVDQGALQFSGRVYRPLTNTTSANAGYFTTQNQGERKHFLSTGISTSLGQTLVNTGLTFDLDNEWLGDLTLRRRFGAHSMRSTTQFATEGFGVNRDRDDSLPSSRSQIRQSLSASGPLPDPFTIRPTYSVRGDFSRLYNGNYNLRLAKNMAARIGTVAVSHSLNYNERQAGTRSSERLSGSISASGSFRRTRWRLRGGYDIQPEAKWNQYNAAISRRLSQNVSGEASLLYAPEFNYTQGGLQANWTTGRWVISPRMTYDTNQELNMSVIARFGLTRNPETGDIVMSSRSMTHSGGVIARVFLDRDGSLTFNEGDELLQNVRIEAVQSHRRAQTDEDGIAFISDLREYQVTDVRIDPLSFEDPYWIPAFEGISVRPRAGTVTTINFPIHISGEIDGTVTLVHEDGMVVPARNTRLVLQDTLGQAVATTLTAYDGFYVFSLIPPGQYYLNVSEEDARTLGVIRPPPIPVEIDYDGTMLYAQNIELLRKDGDVPIAFPGDAFTDYQTRHAEVMHPLPNADRVVLNLGDYHSALALSMVGYRIKTQHADIIGDGHALVLPSDSITDSDHKHTLRFTVPGGTIEAAHQACFELMSHNITCRAEIIPDKEQIAKSKKSSDYLRFVDTRK